MTISPRQRRSVFGHGVMCVLGLVFAGMQAALYAQPAAISKDQAKATIVQRTEIGICADADPPVFQSIAIGKPVRYKPIFGAQETDWLQPVLTDYTVHCTQGNRKRLGDEVQEWQVEVHANFRLYKDPYGAYQVANNFDSDEFDDNQYWDNAQADVHCRAKRLAYLTYDASGKMVKRREDTNTAYGDCNVRMKKLRE